MRADVRVWVANTRQMQGSGSGSWVDALFSVLSDEERIRLARFRFQRDRDMYLLAHGALRIIAATQLGGADAMALQFSAGAHGKPRLVGAAGELNFNISHSDSWVAVATSWSGPCGVDIESQRQIRDWDGVADRFFCGPEQRAIAGSSDPKTMFLRLWTAKEAYLKACGLGLAQELNSFSVVDERGCWCLQDSSASHPVSMARWENQEFLLAACFLDRPDATFDLTMLEAIDPETLRHSAHASGRDSRPEQVKWA